MTKALYQLNLRLNVTSETTVSRSLYSDLSYSKAIAELRGAKYCISTKRAPMEQSRDAADQKVDSLLADGLGVELRKKGKAHQKRLKNLVEKMLFTLAGQSGGAGDAGAAALPDVAAVPDEAAEPVEDQVALLVFRQGTKGIDPPSPIAKNVRKPRINPNGGPKYSYDYDYNYFEGKTTAGVILNYQLNPAWCEFDFELVFTQLCRRHPGCWFHMPIGSAHIEEEPSVRRMTEVAVHYPQNDMDYCLPYVVASCLNYMGHVQEVQRVAATAPNLIYLPGDVVIGRLWTIMQEVLPEVGQCRIFNKRHGQRRKTNVVLTVNDLIRCKTPYLTLVSPKGVGGSADHAVCVVDDIVFDARLVMPSSFVMKL
jgi:hypothetical protein